MNLVEKIAELEILPDKERYEWIIRWLKSEGIPTAVHTYRSGRNIVLKSQRQPFIGIGSHYDTVPNSPGANDNASAIVVCMEIARRLKLEPLKNIGAEIYFFDEEEKGLVGSSAWIRDQGLAGMLGFLNMEMVGSGEHLAIWPVKAGDDWPLLSCFESEARKLDVATHRIDRIVMNTADHESFSLAGLEDSFTVSCISDKDLEVAFHYYKALEFNVSHQTLYEIMSEAPIFKHYHQASDLSEHLSESSLGMTADAIWACICKMDRRNK